MQAVSYDNRMHEEDPTQCVVNLMNVLQTPMERDMLAESDAKRKADPDGDHPFFKMASLNDYNWKALEDDQQELFADLYLFGEHTRIVTRAFREVDGVVYPVVLKDDKPENDQLLGVDLDTGITMKVEEA